MSDNTDPTAITYHLSTQEDGGRFGGYHLKKAVDGPTVGIAKANDKWMCFSVGDDPEFCRCVSRRFPPWCVSRLRGLEAPGFSREIAQAHSRGTLSLTRTHIAIVERTASFAVKSTNSIRFEERIRENQRQDPKISFLHPTDP